MVGLVMVDLISRTPDDHFDVTYAYTDQPISVSSLILQANKLW
jgi:hypothetical protein